MKTMTVMSQPREYRMATCNLQSAIYLQHRKISLVFFIALHFLAFSCISLHFLYCVRSHQTEDTKHTTRTKHPNVKPASQGPGTKKRPISPAIATPDLPRHCPREKKTPPSLLPSSPPAPNGFLQPPSLNSNQFVTRIAVDSNRDHRLIPVAGASPLCCGPSNILR
jgi:hypothetical protein